MSCNVLSKPKITNREYLELMIKHHKVAIRLSELVMFSSDNDFILDYARKNKSKFEDENVFMEKLLHSLPNSQNEAVCGCSRDVLSSNLQSTYPNLFKDVPKCSESDFANVDKIKIKAYSYNNNGVCHNNVLSIDSITDCEYVTNMFYHYKSAIELSILLLKSTKEPKLFVIAQTVIADENKEMFALNYLKNNLYNWKSMIPQNFEK